MYIYMYMITLEMERKTDTWGKLKKWKRVASGGIQTHDTLQSRQMLLPTELPRQPSWQGPNVHVHIIHKLLSFNIPPLWELLLIILISSSWIIKLLLMFSQVVFPLVQSFFHIFQSLFLYKINKMTIDLSIQYVVQRSYELWPHWCTEILWPLTPPYMST